MWSWRNVKYEGATLKLCHTPGHHDLCVAVGLWGHCAEGEESIFFFLNLWNRSRNEESQRNSRFGLALFWGVSDTLSRNYTVSGHVFPSAFPEKFSSCLMSSPLSCFQNNSSFLSWDFHFLQSLFYFWSYSSCRQFYLSHLSSLPFPCCPSVLLSISLIQSPFCSPCTMAHLHCLTLGFTQSSFNLPRVYLPAPPYCFSSS